jgi:hypothetical protein
MLEFIKSDTFWSALTTLATFAGVFAILYAGKQLRFEVWVKAVDIWSSKEFTDHRRAIFRRLDDLQAPWAQEDKDRGLEVCRRIDEFVRLAPYMGQRRMLGVWGDGIAKAWVVLKPLVTEEREATAQPTKWDAFQKLGRKGLGTRPLLYKMPQINADECRQRAMFMGPCFLDIRNHL